MFAGISIDPALMGDLNDESRRFINASQMQDPETAPDPDFEGMRFEEIDQELWEIDRQNDIDYEEWARANAAFHADPRISHG